MQIIEYENKYIDNVRDLLVELEEYMISIDKDELDYLHDDYREKMAIIDLEEVKENNGKCYLAIEDDNIIGLVMGIIPSYDEFDYLDYKCPRRGFITELVVSNKSRGRGVGQSLIEQMEEYFKLEGCEYSFVEAFAYNQKAIDFYNKNGYHPRMHTKIKKI